MNAKEYMLQLKRLDRQIQHKIDERDKYKSYAMSPAASQLDEIGSKTNTPSDKVGNSVARYVDIEAEIADAVYELIQKQREILQTIEQIKSPNEYDLLHQHYFLNISLYDIAEQWEKSYSSITTLHCRALKSLQQILDAKQQVKLC